MTPLGNDQQFVLGIDAGGTKTVCLLAQASDGAVIGRGIGGPGNIRASSAEQVRLALSTAIEAAFVAAGRNRATTTIAAAVIGAAGAARADDRAIVEGLVAQLLPASRYRVTNDAAIALQAALPSGPGVLLISGTGSIGYGRTATGREVRAGGWGYLLDDVGSAYAVGLAGLAAVLRAHDGRGATTALSSSVLAAWNLTNPEQIIGLVYQQPLPRDQIAALAPTVLAAARAGDPVAVAIVKHAGAALGELAVATLRQLDTPSLATMPLITDGGFLRVGADLLLPPLLAVVATAGWSVAQQQAAAEAAAGAVALAQALC